jgi:uncharacterized protein YaiL (DUF2058 family)
MKVMPNVFGQVAQDVVDNLFEIGQSAVKGTAKVATDVVGESIEQITTTPAAATSPAPEKPVESDRTASVEMKKRAEKERFEEVKAELAQFIQRKKQLDQRIEEEKIQETQQKKAVEKQKHDNWIGRIINRSQTNTEKGRLQE